MVFRKNFNTKIKDKKLLVLDLDETLVHARSKVFSDEADFSFTLTEDGSIFYVKLRPGLQSFLERVSNMFNVMIFTSSEKEYADHIINFLYPKGTLISRRAYRESGKDLREGYVKDLSVLGHDLSKVALIDNCRSYFRFQKDNGILIKSWYGDVPNDAELCLLLPFLEELAVTEDVRLVIAERFGCRDKGSSIKKKSKSNAGQSLVKPTENLKAKKGKKGPKLV